ncbi:hypothetical protein [Companilactobacillus paralimentarius]|uniref:hypothetical protein n=1 Tax=Companilactobacillus paralimentarius TaxID=83526 RepID=UPI00384C59BD
MQWLEFVNSILDIIGTIFGIIATWRSSKNKKALEKIQNNMFSIGKNNNQINGDNNKVG